MRCLPLDPEGKDLSTQNLDYISLCKQERKKMWWLWQNTFYNFSDCNVCCEKNVF